MRSGMGSATYDAAVINGAVRIPVRTTVRASRGSVALADHVPVVGLRDVDGEVDEFPAHVGVPEPTPGEVDALVVQEAGSLAEAPGVLLFLVGKAEVEDTFIGDLHSRGRPRGAIAPQLETGRPGLARIDAEELHGLARPLICLGHSNAAIQ